MFQLLRKSKNFQLSNASQNSLPTHSNFPAHLRRRQPRTFQSCLLLILPVDINLLLLLHTLSKQTNMVSLLYAPTCSTGPIARADASPRVLSLSHLLLTHPPSQTSLNANKKRSAQYVKTQTFSPCLIKNKLPSLKKPFLFWTMIKMGLFENRI